MKTTLFVCFIFSSLFWYTNNLYSQNTTAKQNKYMVDSLMNTINPNAKLRWIKSDSVFIDGTSLSWNYQYSYFSEDTNTNYFFHTTLDSFVYDSLNHLATLGIMYIDTSWIDSDSALTLADDEGGSDFRNNHTSFKIIASLGKPLVPNSTNRWYIYYISSDDPSDKLFINLNATDNIVDGLRKIESLPIGLDLYQNYPNPFNPHTTIRFAIPKTGYVVLDVYNIIGKEINTLVKEYKTPGNYIVEFNGSELASGVYYYKLEFESFSKVKKFILLK